MTKEEMRAAFGDALHPERSELPDSAPQRWRVVVSVEGQRLELDLRGGTLLSWRYVDPYLRGQRR
jgi:hypothetical protein